MKSGLFIRAALSTYRPAKSNFYQPAANRVLTGKSLFDLFRQFGGQKLAEFGIRFDQPHDTQQVFLAFAGAAFRVLLGENLSTQRVRQTRHAHEVAPRRVVYDPRKAGDCVKADLLSLLPER